jgi:hypothetical protein
MLQYQREFSKIIINNCISCARSGVDGRIAKKFTHLVSILCDVYHLIDSQISVFAWRKTNVFLAGLVRNFFVCPLENFFTNDFFYNLQISQG